MNIPNNKYSIFGTFYGSPSHYNINGDDLIIIKYKIHKVCETKYYLYIVVETNNINILKYWLGSFRKVSSRFGLRVSNKTTGEHFNVQPMFNDC
jgi:hypothetical protein